MTPKLPVNGPIEHGLDNVVDDLKRFVEDTERERTAREASEWTWRQAIDRIPTGLKTGIIAALAFTVFTMAKVMWEDKGRRDDQQEASHAALVEWVRTIDNRTSDLPSIRDTVGEIRALLWQDRAEALRAKERAARRRGDYDDVKAYSAELRALASRQAAIGREETARP
jgi:hypothetical protein